MDGTCKVISQINILQFHIVVIITINIIIITKTCTMMATFLQFEFPSHLYNIAFF